MDFPVSGVSCSPLMPPLVAFLISIFTSSAGLSGAFLLLPFQMSVLGFTSPAVSPTNLIFNIVASPGGVYRYAREGRMAWALTGVVVAGTLPGVFAGALIRVRWLADARNMKLFVGLVLLYLAWRLLAGSRNANCVRCGGARVRTTRFSLTRVSYEFAGSIYSFNPLMMFALSLVVGVIGGIYGIGGAAIITPFVVAILGLPVYTVAGAALFGTFITSVAGVFSFQMLGVQPDWALGALFGVGGLAGTYAGARMQKHLPERWIRVLLGVLAAGLAVNYIVRY
jgi:uncharacterized membrane protein YfcA